MDIFKTNIGPKAERRAIQQLARAEIGLEDVVKRRRSVAHLVELLQDLQTASWWGVDMARAARLWQNVWKMMQESNDNIIACLSKACNLHFRFNQCVAACQDGTRCKRKWVSQTTRRCRQHVVPIQEFIETAYSMLRRAHIPQHLAQCILEDVIVARSPSIPPEFQ